MALLALFVGAGFLAWLGAHARYRFLNEFNAQERALSGLSMVSGRGQARCFSFTEPAAKVMAAVERDLHADGWQTTYRDPWIVLFRRKYKLFHKAVLGSEYAACEARDQDWKSEPTSVTTLLWLPYQPTWFENQISAIETRLSKKRVLLPTDVIPKSIGVSASYEIKRMADSAKADILFRNLEATKETIEIKTADLDDYEVNEKLPISLQLAPSQFKIQTFTYPIAASQSAPKALRLGYKYSGASDGLETVSQVGHPEPDVSNIIEKGENVLGIGNLRKDRVFEIANLKITVEGSTIRSIPGIVSVNPGTTLKIRFPFDQNAEPSLKFKYRLKPNKDWRTFELGDQ